ncbi:MAG: response regulator [Chloroflexi bacterium]|nr:response regulator [Chloroflexota bacterium]
MNAFFAPAIALMNRLKYPAKFLLIGLLLLLPLAIALNQYLRQINKDIDFADKEQVGLEYNEPVMQLLQNIQQHAALASMYLSGRTDFQDEIDAKEAEIDANIREVDKIEARLGKTLGTTENWTEVKDTWSRLKVNFYDLTAENSIAGHDTLVGEILDLITVVGNNSNLILDPRIESYYLMDTLVIRLPMRTQFLSQIRNYSLIVTTHGEFSPSEQTRLEIFSGLVQSNLQGNLKGFDYVYGADRDVEVALRDDVEKHNTTTRQFLTTVNGAFLRVTRESDTAVSVSSDRFYEISTDAINETFTFYTQVSPELDKLLQERIDEYAMRRNGVIASALIGLAIAIYLFVGFYLAVRKTIAALDYTSKRMVSGDTSDTLKLDNRDELAQVAISFNNIATELMLTRDRALEANRAKSTFLANMSHELRTPLNAILGYTGLMLASKYGPVTDQQQDRMQRVIDNGQHLLGLINDVLDLSKIEAGKMELYLETFSVTELLEGVANTARPLVEKNNNVLEVVQYSANLGAIHADLTKVRQVLSNLLSNAAKFTQNGKVTLSAASRYTTGMEYLVFQVEDTGIGIAPNQLDNVFKEFTQGDSSTTRKYGGTGLGLAICRHFSLMMGGDIKVESELGKGSIFTVTIPRRVVDPNVKPIAPVQTVPSSASTVTVTTPETQTKNSTVLVIDDDATIREMMEHYLTKEGFKVITASGGREGLRLAKEAHPTVITLDVMMPDIDGWGVLALLKADPEIGHIPVVMITIVDDRKIGFTLGASDYITKPLRAEILLKTLRKYGCENPPCPVMVVEDDDSTRKLMREILESEGWRVSEAANGKVALEVMAENRPSVIVLDLMMPEMDGFQFIEAMRQNEEWRRIPVVVVTALDLTSDDRQRLNGYVQKVIQKGQYRREELLQQVIDLVNAYG